MNTSVEFVPLSFGILTISDTRTLQDDRSGQVLCDKLQQAGHHLSSRKIISDDKLAIRSQVQAWIEDPKIRVVLTTGGTGFTGRDVTPEAVEPLYTKAIPGFGELFRMLSYEEIGTSTIQSRVTGGLCKDTLVFALPGSPGACTTAMDKILLPQLDRRHRPCNFVQIMDRMLEA